MQKTITRFALGIAAAGIMLASAIPAFAANPASAPADGIGPTVSTVAKTIEPNFGLAVCKPAGTTQTEDDGALLLLGLTPPGNTP